MLYIYIYVYQSYMCTCVIDYMFWTACTQKRDGMPPHPFCVY